MCVCHVKCISLRGLQPDRLSVGRPWAYSSGGWGLRCRTQILESGCLDSSLSSASSHWHDLFMPQFPYHETGRLGVAPSHLVVVRIEVSIWDGNCRGYCRCRGKVGLRPAPGVPGLAGSCPSLLALKALSLVTTSLESRGWIRVTLLMCTDSSFQAFLGLCPGHLIAHDKNLPGRLHLQFPCVHQTSSPGSVLGQKTWHGFRDSSSSGRDQQGHSVYSNWWRESSGCCWSPEKEARKASWRRCAVSH